MSYFICPLHSRHQNLLGLQVLYFLKIAIHPLKNRKGKLLMTQNEYLSIMVRMHKRTKISSMSNLICSNNVYLIGPAHLLVLCCIFAILSISNC